MSDDSGFQVPPGLTEAFGRWFDDLMPHAVKFFDDAAGLPQHDTVMPLGEPLTWAQNVSDATPTIRKASAIVHVPDELLMDAGVIPDTRPPARDLRPWHHKIAFRIVKWWDKRRNRAAYRAFKIIAGYEVPDYYAGDE